MTGPQITVRPQGYNSFRSWLAVFGSSLALFCTVGYLNAFGVFQEFYVDFLPGRSASDISWIGSISIFILYAGSLITGPLVDKVGPKILLRIGSVLLVFALFMISLCTKYYQLFLAQGVLVGIAMTLLLSPALAIVSRRMAHRRGLALGLCVGGSSIGGVIWPIMLQQLLDKDNVSFGWAMRAVAFAMIPLLAVACLTVIDAPVSGLAPRGTPTEQGSASPSTSPEQVEKSADGDGPDSKPLPKSGLSIVKDRSFILLSAGLTVGYLGLLTPLFYVSAYALTLGQSSSTSFYLLAGLNAASFFGRVIPGHLADHYGHYNIEVLALLFSGVIGFCWTSVTDVAGLIVWSLAYGLASGAVISLQSACAGKIAPHQSQGTAVGLLTGFISIAALVGTPISGQILGHSGYLALSMWTGATLVLGAAIVGAARQNVNRKILYAF